VIWDAAAGTLLITLDHPDGVASAAFSPDGLLVVTAGDDKIAPPAVPSWLATPVRSAACPTHPPPRAGASTR